MNSKFYFIHKSNSFSGQFNFLECWEKDINNYSVIYYDELGMSFIPAVVNPKKDFEKLVSKKTYEAISKHELALILLRLNLTTTSDIDCEDDFLEEEICPS